MRKRWIYKDGIGIPAEEYVPNSVPFYVMPDIQPYQSMIDGSMITSRSKHREHLKTHGCVEIGNDSSLNRPPTPLQPPPGLKEAISDAYERVKHGHSR